VAVRRDLPPRRTPGGWRRARHPAPALVSAGRGSHGGGRCSNAARVAPGSGAFDGVSFHPNDVQRRARTAGALLGLTFLVLLGAFFRTQIVENKAYALQSEENRLSEVPLPAPRGIIYDRHGEIIAENL